MTLIPQCSRNIYTRFFYWAGSLLLLLLPSLAIASTAAYRINVGGGAYTDSSGYIWSADKNYNTGNVYSSANSIANTSNQTLFKTNRYDNTGSPELTYSLPIANGRYQINLYFAETYAPLQQAGARVFNVLIENTLVFNRLDVYASAGANKALIKTAYADVSDGVLNITFQHVVQNPMVSAIEVLDTSGTATAQAKSLLGVYYGNQGFNMQQVKDIEAWQGKKNAVINMFRSWCSTQNDDLFTRELPNVWANRNVPLITWEPYYCTASSTPSDVETRAANGQYDSYLNDFANRMKTWLAGPDGVYATGDDRRVYIRLAHEMNGNWYPWSGNPSDYIRMWRRVKSIFESKGLDPSHVQFMWVVNVGDNGSYTAEQYWPGDAYVDWVGVDGYNAYSATRWLSPSARFTTMLGRLKTLTSRPVAIAEVGVMSATGTGVNLSTKSQWITDFFAYVATRPEVKMIVYFNKDTASDKDYGIFGGMRGTGTYTASTTYNIFSNYRNGVRATNVLSSDSSNSRLLSDSVFMGKF